MKTLEFPVGKTDLHEICKPLTEFVGFGGIAMKTVHCSFGKVPVEHVIEGLAIPTEVTATSDGRPYVGGWHEGESVGSVFVERYTLEGREFHGWIDSQSRKLVQVG